MSNHDRASNAPPWLRAWSCPGGWLLWRGPAARPISASLAMRRASSEPLPEPPGDYWQISPGGAITAKHDSESWSVEDELGAHLYVVADGSLIQVYVSDFFRYEPTIRERVVVTGLSPVATDDAEAWRRIWNALAAEEARLREAGLDEAGRKRLAAFPGALESFEAGEGFQRAQARLRATVARHHWAPDDEAALRALVAYGVLHRAAQGEWRTALEWAMDPLVTACRVATFDHLADQVVPAPPPANPSPAPAGQRDELRSLGDLLESLRAELLRCARQLWEGDAVRDAAELRKAADGVATARSRLAELLERTPGEPENPA